MATTIERRRHQLDIGTIGGLGLLSLASLAEAGRLIGLELDWFGSGGGADRALSVVWIVGLVGFGVAFATVWLIGQRLGPSEREALGDELAVFLARKTAVGAFVVTYLAALVLAAIPSTVGLPGRAVALLIVAVATASVAGGRLVAARS